MVVLQFCLVKTSVFALVGRTLRRSRGNLTRQGEGFAFVVGTQFSIRWKIDSKAASLRRDREVLRSMWGRLFGRRSFDKMDLDKGNRASIFLHVRHPSCEADENRTPV
ncbi:hypothetical protein MRX96_043292 [Rhipicephalus microplus]